ncbi:prolipoprotein diacylglyceryl transferase [Candidatus Gracilibacteria bacterium]|nr:prolipoprotein diacylglyceryl transferase [Candidatus Gracilibacteria bacterium]
MITIYSRWFFITLGFIAGCMLFASLIRRNRITVTIVTDNAVMLFVWSLIVSRIFFIVTHSEFYIFDFHPAHIFSLLNISDKGLSFWGVMLGFAMGIWYLQKKSVEPLQRVFDVIVPSITFGFVFASFGAFLEGANYGIPTELPWGVEFHSAQVKYVLPLHPTQIYSALYSGLITLILVKMYRHAKTHRMEGFISEVGLFLYSICRFLEEFVRGDDVLELFGIRISQILAFAGIIVSSYLLYQRYTNKKGGDPEYILRTRVHDALSKLKIGTKA